MILPLLPVCDLLCRSCFLCCAVLLLVKEFSVKLATHLKVTFTSVD